MSKYVKKGRKQAGGGDQDATHKSCTECGERKLLCLFGDCKQMIRGKPQTYKRNQCQACRTGKRRAELRIDPPMLHPEQSPAVSAAAIEEADYEPDVMVRDSIRPLTLQAEEPAPVPAQAVPVPVFAMPEPSPPPPHTPTRPSSVDPVSTHSQDGEADAWDGLMLPRHMQTRPALPKRVQRGLDQGKGAYGSALQNWAKSPQELWFWHNKPPRSREPLFARSLSGQAKDEMCWMREKAEEHAQRFRAEQLERCVEYETVEDERRDFLQDSLNTTHPRSGLVLTFEFHFRHIVTGNVYDPDDAWLDDYLENYTPLIDYPLEAFSAPHFAHYDPPYFMSQRNPTEDEMEQMFLDRGMEFDRLGYRAFREHLHAKYEAPDPGTRGSAAEYAERCREPQIGIGIKNGFDMDQENLVDYIMRTHGKVMYDVYGEFAFT